MFLVESYQGGKLIQAEFDQKLIYATEEAYREIQDAGEIERLKDLLKQLRRPAKPKPRPQSSTTVRAGRMRMRSRAVLLGASISLLGWAASVVSMDSGLMHPFVWAVIGGLAGLLGRVLSERSREA